MKWRYCSIFKMLLIQNASYSTTKHLSRLCKFVLVAPKAQYQFNEKKNKKNFYCVNEKKVSIWKCKPFGKINMLRWWVVWVQFNKVEAWRFRRNCPSLKWMDGRWLLHTDRSNVFASAYPHDNLCFCLRFLFSHNWRATSASDLSSDRPPPSSSVPQLFSDEPCPPLRYDEVDYCDNVGVVIFCL